MKKIHKALGEVNTRCGKSLWKEEDLYLTTRWQLVTCKKCLRLKPKHNIHKIQSKKNKEVAGQDVIVAMSD